MYVLDQLNGHVGIRASNRSDSYERLDHVRRHSGERLRRGRLIVIQTGGVGHVIRGVDRAINKMRSRRVVPGHIRSKRHRAWEPNLALTLLTRPLMEAVAACRLELSGQDLDCEISHILCACAQIHSDGSRLDRRVHRVHFRFQLARESVHLLLCRGGGVRIPGKKTLKFERNVNGFIGLEN